MRPKLLSKPAVASATSGSNNAGATATLVASYSMSVWHPLTSFLSVARCTVPYNLTIVNEMVRVQIPCLPYGVGVPEKSPSWTFKEA